MARIQECILYRDFQHGEILQKMTMLMCVYEEQQSKLTEKRELFYECANGLVEIAGSYGFSGNLWHNYLTFLLVNHENAFSTASEIRGAVEGSINELALHDFAILKSCMILICGCLTGFSVPPAVIFFAIITILTATAKCSINASGTVSAL